MHIFMPGLRAYLASSLASEAVDGSLQPEQVMIYLPSLIPESHRQKLCIPGLPEIEERLRFAQAVEALSALCRHL